METRLSRARWYLAPLLFALLLQSAPAATTEERCAGVQPIADIEFDGRILRSTPDIQEPTLRRADALLSMHCYDLYQQVIDEYVAKHPDDDRVWFLYARMTWVFDQKLKAQALMTRALAKRPDFTSIKVLQATIAIEENRLADAQTLLTQIEKEQPQDLGLFMDQLRLDALLLSDAATTRALLAVLESPAFPGPTRETAFAALRQIRNQSLDVLERAYRAQLTFESANCYECKAHDLAAFLINTRGKPEQAHAVLDPLLASEDYQYLWERLRQLKVDAYLMQAAQPKLDQAQRKALVEQAGKVVGNDWAQVEERVALRPEMLGMLQEYIPQGSVAETTDEYGRTVLCNAVIASNVYAVRAALRRGANPNGKCESWSLVQYMFMVGWSSPENEREVTGRTDILRALLAAGAKPPKHFDSCSGLCQKYLMPVLREFPEGPRV